VLISYRVAKVLSTILFLVAPAFASVWVGYDGGLAQYTDDGDFVQRYEDYRRPVSLQLDAQRGHLWFIDAYDYKLVCFDVAAGTALFFITDAAHTADITTSDIRIYLREKRPVEPSLALDAGDGGVWLADFYNHEIAKYSAEGKELFRTGAFHEPFAIAALGDGSAWVAAGIRTLNLVGADGKTELSQAGVNEARALAYDKERELVWVADYRNNRVLGVTRRGQLKRKITRIELPSALAVDAARGIVWVATHYAGILRISADDEEITGAIAEPESISALTLDAEGRLWVAYDEDGEVIRYSPAGEREVVIKRVNTPTGIAAD